MCKKAILPTVMRAELVYSDTANLIYVFNRWLSVLDRYGKLDSHQSDFTIIAKVIKKSTDKSIRRTVTNCRDYALAETISVEDLRRCLRKALRLLSDTHDTDHLRKVKQACDDLGMTEKYSHLSKRLAREKIRKIGRTVLFTDDRADDANTLRLVRRFVEKRAAQAAYRLAKDRDLESNRFRQSVRRAVSFSLYKKRYVDYDVSLRISGTHWKVCKTKGMDPRLVAKISYNSYEEAEAACNLHRRNHPDDPLPINPYICEYCGKWHIGHQRPQGTTDTSANPVVYEAC